MVDDHSHGTCPCVRRGKACQSLCVPVYGSMLIESTGWGAGLSLHEHSAIQHAYCIILSQAFDFWQCGEQAVGIPRDVLSDLPPDLRVLVLAENGVELPENAAFETGFMIPASSASPGAAQPPTLPEAMEVSTAERETPPPLLAMPSSAGAAAEPMSQQESAGDAGPSTSTGMVPRQLSGLVW